MSELVVYGQKELDAAIETDARVITLCAGEFRIPLCRDIEFRRIGPVKVTVDCTARAAESAGMRFERIFPAFAENTYAVYKRELMNVVRAEGSGGSYIGSYGSGGSYIGSYGSGGSYIGSGRGGSYTLLRGSGGSAPDGTFVCRDRVVTVFGYGIDLI